MINNANNKKNNTNKEINLLKSLKKGFKRGLEVQVLPDNINKIYNNIWIRICRVIGGICAVAVLTNKHILLPIPLNSLVVGIGFLQLLQISIVSIIKFRSLLHNLKHHPEKFEVRNPPLDR